MALLWLGWSCRRTGYTWVRGGGLGLGNGLLLGRLLRRRGIVHNDLLGRLRCHTGLCLLQCCAQPGDLEFLGSRQSFHAVGKRTPAVLESADIVLQGLKLVLGTERSRRLRQRFEHIVERD